MTNFKKHLFFTADYSKALQEIEEAGGYVTQKFTNILFAASLPEGFDAGTLKHAATEPAGPLDEISALMAEAWEGYMLTMQNKSEKENPVTAQSAAFQHTAITGMKEPGNSADKKLVKNNIPAPTSQKLTGNICVGLILVSSTGSEYQISRPEEIKIVSGVMQAAELLTEISRAAKAKTTFLYNTFSLAIDRNSPLDYDYLINDALVQLKYPPGDKGCVDFVNALIARNKSDWAYLAFITKLAPIISRYKSSSVAMGFNPSFYKEGWISGAFILITCLIFGGFYEYDVDADCGYGGIHRIPNYNSRGCYSGMFQITNCIMRLGQPESDSGYFLCPWTMAQIGLINPRINVDGKPFAMAADNQNELHFIYRDQYNQLSDIFYVVSEQWHFRNLNLLLPAAPLAQGDPCSINFNQGLQIHNVYRDVNNQLSDIYYDKLSTWHYQNLNALVNGAPAAKGDPFVLVYLEEEQHNLYRDANNQVSDIWYSLKTGLWKYQNLNTLVNGAPAAQGNPFAFVYYNPAGQPELRHNIYRDTNNHISDIFYSLKTGLWQYQDLNTLVSGAPPAQGDPSIIGYFNGLEQHCFYRDANNHISDIFYNYYSGWRYSNLHELLKEAPLAKTDPYIVIFYHGFELHCIYTDVNNQISDMYYVVNIGWRYQNISQLVPEAALAQSSLVITVLNDQSRQYVYRDVNNQLSQISWKENAWSYRLFFPE